MYSLNVPLTITQRVVSGIVWTWKKLNDAYWSNKPGIMGEVAYQATILCVTLSHLKRSFTTRNTLYDTNVDQCWRIRIHKQPLTSWYLFNAVLSSHCPRLACLDYLQIRFWALLAAHSIMQPLCLFFDYHTRPSVRYALETSYALKLRWVFIMHQVHIGRVPSILWIHNLTAQLGSKGISSGLTILKEVPILNSERFC